MHDCIGTHVYDVAIPIMFDPKGYSAVAARAQNFHTDPVPLYPAIIIRIDPYPLTLHRVPEPIRQPGCVYFGHDEWLRGGLLLTSRGVLILHQRFTCRRTRRARATGCICSVIVLLPAILLSAIVPSVVLLHLIVPFIVLYLVTTVCFREDAVTSHHCWYAK